MCKLRLIDHKGAFLAPLPSQLISRPLLSFLIEIHCFLLRLFPLFFPAALFFPSVWFMVLEENWVLWARRQRNDQKGWFGQDWNKWVTEGGDLGSTDLAGDRKEVSVLVRSGFMTERFQGRCRVLVAAPRGLRDLGQCRLTLVSLNWEALHHDSQASLSELKWNENMWHCYSDISHSS